MSQADIFADPETADRNIKKYDEARRVEYFRLAAEKGTLLYPGVPEDPPEITAPLPETPSPGVNPSGEISSTSDHTIALLNLKEWAITILVYEPLYKTQIPYFLPETMFRNSIEGLILITGYHTFKLQSDDEGYQEFRDWLEEKGELKVIGVIKTIE